MRTHVHPSSQIKYGDNTTSEGVLFATYSALIGESQAGGQHRTRIRQILEWCGSAFDGVVSWLAKGWGGGGGPRGGRGCRGGAEGEGGALGAQATGDITRPEDLAWWHCAREGLPQ